MKEYTGNWRDTISTLQNLFNTDNYAQDSPLVTEHLEALIDCIKELSAENKKLHEEYEKVSIQTCRVKNKFMDYTKKRTSDLNEAIDRVRKNNRKASKLVMKKLAVVHRDAVETEESTVSFEKENETLVDVSADSRKQSEDLIQTMSDVLQNISTAKIEVTETKIEVYSTLENSLSVFEQIDETTDETTEYCNETKNDITDFENEAESIQTKIDEQDNETEKLQDIVWRLGKEIYANQIQTKEFEQILGGEENNLAALKIKGEKLIKKINNEKEVRDHEASICKCLHEDFEFEQTQFERRIEEKKDEVRDLQREISEEKLARERIMLDYEWLVASLIASKNKVFTLQTETKMDKQDIRTANNVFADVWLEKARLKEEASMLHENLFMVADSRETMEKIYSKKLRLIRNDLLDEMHLKLKAEKECKLLEDFYEKYMKSDLPYKIDANLQENLEAEQDKIYTKICKKEKTQKKIKIDTKDEVTRFETKKETIEVQINDIEERIHKEAVIVNDLTEIQEFNQQKVDVLKKQWDDLEKEAIDLVKDHQSQMKKGSDIKQNMIVIELQKDALRLEAHQLKNALDEMDEEVQAKLKRMKREVFQMNWQIFKLMYRFYHVHAANREILDAIERKRGIIRKEQLEFDRVSDDILQYSRLLGSFRILFQQLSNEKNTLSKQVNFHIMNALQAVVGIKANSELRLTQISETARHMESLIESCIFISEPSRPMGSDFHLKKMEELKKERMELLEPQFTRGAITLET